MSSGCSEQLSSLQAMVLLRRCYQPRLGLLNAEEVSAAGELVELGALDGDHGVTDLGVRWGEAMLSTPRPM